MTPDRVAELARWMRAQGVSELETVVDGHCVAIRLVGHGPVQPSPRATQTDITPRARITSSFVGRLRLTHPRASAPEITVGEQVTDGQIVAFVDVGTLLHPVTAEGSGRLIRWLVDDGGPVAYGQILAEVD